MRSPRIAHRGEVYLSYAYARAKGPAPSAEADGFLAPRNGYFLLDHDQRHTLHTGFNFSLPKGVIAGGNLYYGSGFTEDRATCRRICRGTLRSIYRSANQSPRT